MVENYKIILASGSPRRKELLAGLGLDYEVRLLPDVDESYDADLVGEEIPIAISQKKSNAYRHTLKQNELIITADTIVYIDNQVLGKPKDASEAKAMLRKLSGRTHQVITGITLLTQHTQQSFACTTEVCFSSLTEQEIDFYVNTFQPLDKAGAYGVQEWIGYIGVAHIQGSYYNVMGLPVQKLYSELKKICL